MRLRKDLKKDPFRDRDGQAQHLKDQKEQEASVKVNCLKNKGKNQESKISEMPVISLDKCRR